MGNNSKSSVMEPPPVETGGSNGAGTKAERRAAGKETDAPTATQEAQPGPARTVWREYFESLVVTAIMALFGMTFVVQAVKVPTGSMQNTILIGDHLLVNKFIFAPGPHLPLLPQRDIRRGDIIVFKYPGKYQGEARFRNAMGVDDTAPNNRPFITNYVKRVIGLPGDTVEVRGMQVLVNDQPLAEHRLFARNPPDDDPYTSGQESGAPLTVLNNPPPTGEGPYNVYWKPEWHSTQVRAVEGEKFVVPKDHYFVMGDNRDNSADSRYWGFVPRDLIIGRAMFVYWSYDESAPSTGFFLSDFIKNTRWSRTGTMVK